MIDERKTYVSALSDFREHMLEKMSVWQKGTLSYCDVVEFMNETKLELEVAKYERSEIKAD